jgi:hypothetical protein
MVHGVRNDVSNVVIDERVHGLSTMSLHADESGASQNPKVLGYERLAHLKLFNQFVDVAGPLSELDHDGEAGRRSQHPE